MLSKTDKLTMKSNINSDLESQRIISPSRSTTLIEILKLFLSTMAILTNIVLILLVLSVHKTDQIFPPGNDNGDGSAQVINSTIINSTIIIHPTPAPYASLQVGGVRITLGKKLDGLSVTNPTTDPHFIGVSNTTDNG